MKYIHARRKAVYQCHKLWIWEQHSVTANVMDCTNLLHQLKISMIDAIPWQRIDNSMPRRYIKQGRKKVKEWWKARVKPKLLPPPREGGFVSSSDISPSSLIVRHSWCSPIATTQQARRVVFHHCYHEWHEPPRQ